MTSVRDHVLNAAFDRSTRFPQFNLGLAGASYDEDVVPVVSQLSS